MPADEHPVGLGADGREGPPGVPSTFAVDTEQGAGVPALVSGQPSVEYGGTMLRQPALSPSQSLVAGPAAGITRGDYLEAEQSVGGIEAQPASPSQISRGSVYVVGLDRGQKRKLPDAPEQQPRGPGRSTGSATPRRGHSSG